MSLLWTSVRNLNYLKIDLKPALPKISFLFLIPDLIIYHLSEKPMNYITQSLKYIRLIFLIIPILYEIKQNPMNNFFRTIIAAWGAKKLGGGCISTVIIFIIIYMILKQCT